MKSVLAASGNNSEKCFEFFIQSLDQWQGLKSMDFSCIQNLSLNINCFKLLKNKLCDISEIIQRIPKLKLLIM